MNAAEKEFYQSLGGKLQVARLQCGLSQENIGDVLQVTFQQIQKYEKGIDRISICKLRLWSEATGADLLTFFDNAVDPIFSGSRINLEFIREFNDMLPDFQTKIVSLMRSINGVSHG